jgi:hypothetical protein
MQKINKISKSWKRRLDKWYWEILIGLHCGNYMITIVKWGCLKNNDYMYRFRDYMNSREIEWCEEDRLALCRGVESSNKRNKIAIYYSRG